MNASSPDFFAKHEFLIRRLHSLSGLIPVGAYMVVHLTVNASLLNGPAAFQKNVLQIHSLDKMLPLVEWAFIFLPIIFHAVIGVWIIRTGKTNTSAYRYGPNWRYALQRWTGVVAILFIFTHVFHLHGWFHGHWWLKSVAEPLGMAQFRPFNAASTLAFAMRGVVWPIFYTIGVVSCVFHLANGIWTMGITWGLWTTPRSQKIFTYVCGVFGALLLVVGLSALVATKTTDPREAIAIEDEMIDARSAELDTQSHKRLTAAERDRIIGTEAGEPARASSGSATDASETQSTGSGETDSKPPSESKGH